MAVCNRETSLAYLIPHLKKLCRPAQQETHHSNMASQSGQVEVGEAKGLLFLLTSIVLIDDSFDTFYASLYLSDNLIW